MTYSGMSKESAILCVKSQLLLPGKDPGKDVRMPKTAAVVQLPEILRNKSGHLEPGDLGSAPPPKRGRLCETCCFFAGIPDEQVPEMTLTPAPQDLVLVV